MRSKCRRYSSSSASRSPCCPRSTRRRTCSFDALAAVAAARVASSAITPGMPLPARRLTRGRSPEADPAFAREPLDVHDPLERDGVAAVLGLERQRGLACARTNLGRAERLLERVRARGGDEGAHDLPTV